MVWFGWWVIKYVDRVMAGGMKKNKPKRQVIHAEDESSEAHLSTSLHTGTCNSELKNACTILRICISPPRVYVLINGAHKLNVANTLHAIWMERFM